MKNIKNGLNLNLKNHKQELESISDKHRLTLDKDLEVFKGNLERLSFEHQTRYYKLHSDKAKTIKTLFTLLLELEMKMESLMRPFQGINEKPIEDKFNLASKAANSFTGYYRINEILFNQKTCELFIKINDSFLKSWEDFSHSRRLKFGPTPEDTKRLIDNELTRIIHGFRYEKSKCYYIW